MSLGVWHFAGSPTLEKQWFAFADIPQQAGMSLGLQTGESAQGAGDPGETGEPGVPLNCTL